MFFAFFEQKVDVLNLKHFPNYCFLWQANVIESCDFADILLICLGVVLSHDFSEQLKYVTYISWCLSILNLSSKNIVESISTAFCFCLCGDKTH